ncbi:MAG: ATP-binding protein [Pseudomonadota bacterium]|jgi:signal transduction histidine kinase
MIAIEATRVRADLSLQAADELDLLMPALLDEALLSDHTKIDRMLQARSSRRTLAHIRWVDKRGAVSHAPRVSEDITAPAWFVEWLDLPPAAIWREVSVAGETHGYVFLELSRAPAINRLWTQFLSGVEALTVVIIIAFCMTALILKNSLRPLHVLRLGASRFAAGDHGTRVDASGPPEILQTIQAFNHMAGDIQELLSRLRRLGAHMEAAREQHYKVIARELHDSLGGSLSMIRLGLASLGEDLASDDQKHAQVQSLLRKADDSIRIARNLISALRPETIDRKGLAATIRWYAEEFSRVTDIACEIDLKAVLQPAPDQNIGVFRIVQEALTNIAKHSGASRVSLTTRDSHGNFVLAISDNGRGISQQELRGSQSFGLLAMQERARILNATLEFSPSPSGGTTVTLNLPVTTTQLSLL